MDLDLDIINYYTTVIKWLFLFINERSKWKRKIDMLVVFSKSHGFEPSTSRLQYNNSNWSTIEYSCYETVIMCTTVIFVFIYYKLLYN